MRWMHRRCKFSGMNIDYVNFLPSLSLTRLTSTRYENSCKQFVQQCRTVQYRTAAIQIPPVPFPCRVSRPVARKKSVGALPQPLSLPLPSPSPPLPLLHIPPILPFPSLPFLPSHPFTSPVSRFRGQKMLNKCVF